MTIDIKYIGKVTASMEVLNRLSIALGEAAEHPWNKGDFGERMYREAANQIYNELDKRGLYDEFK